MGCSIFVYLKKIFSLSLILNSLITLAAVAGILYGFYSAWPYWKPYSPYLINGNLFLLVAAAAVINIFPSACIGRCLHTGRLWFHHYVYGFLFLLSSSIYVVVFTSVSLLSLFLINTSNVAVNAGRFFVLTGLTLFLDDFPDVSKRVESTLNRLKSRVYQWRKAIHMIQLFTGFVTFYVFLAVSIWVAQNPEQIFPRSFIIGTLLITSLTSFACVKRKAYLKIIPAK